MVKKKKYQFIICLMLCCSLLFSCNKGGKQPFLKNREKPVSGENKEKEFSEESWEKGYDLPIGEKEKKEAEADCKKVMGMVSDLYEKADKGDSLNVVLSDKAMNRMAKKIGEIGNLVSTSKVYSNMKNYKKLEKFLKDSLSEKCGSVVLYEIHADGGIGRKKFIYDGTDMYVAAVNAFWNDNYEPVVSNFSYTRLKEWNYSEKGWFCYELCVPEYPEVTEMVDGSCLVRVKPISRKKRLFSEKYVYGLGYQGNNLLCSNWDENHMQDLDYNGLYEYLYEMKYKKKFTLKKGLNGIPKEAFENLIQEYMPITSEMIQKYAVFDAESQTYLWSELGCFNYTPDSFGTAIPEVTKIRENKDGTITLTVNAVCEAMLCNEAVITHELAIQLTENGGFCYKGNKILKNGIKKLPNYHYRIKKKTSKTAGILAKKDKKGRLKFSMGIEDFIACYNKFYSKDYGENYIQPYTEWNSYIEESGKHSGDIHYEFTADKKAWTLPTITVYTSKNEKAIRELTVNFDDHSYTDTVYHQYEELCFYTLKVFFPDFTKKRITGLYKKLNQLAYQNIFPNAKGFLSGNPPSVLYYQKEIGVYPYFAYGESLRMCIIPVTSELIKEYEKQGVAVILSIP